METNEQFTIAYKKVAQCVNLNERLQMIFDPQICISLSMYLHRAIVLLRANSTDSCSCCRCCLSRNPEMFLYIKRINNNDFHPLGKNETKFQIALGDGLSKTVLLFPLFSQVWTAVQLRT